MIDPVIVIDEAEKWEKILVAAVPQGPSDQAGRRMTKWLAFLSLSSAALRKAQGPATYEGRIDRKAGRRREEEGELVIYTSAQSDDIGAVAKAFEAKYGVKVNLWRAGSEKVLQRAVTEARGGRHAVDVIETNGPELEMLHREQILQAVKSPRLADLIPAARRPHGEWSARG